jgi:hypothetical protein
MIDNAVIHFYPRSPYIARAAVNIREGERIRGRFILRDVSAARDFLRRVYPAIPSRVIVHTGGGASNV